VEVSPGIVFKGVTSSSECYCVVKRFSEDKEGVDYDGN